ncbi:FtsW/RodA/SpoVE family cell cycle protein [Anaerotignum sp.]
MPNTGQPLPFISYGGTSLLFLTIMIGLLLNISRYQKD